MRKTLFAGLTVLEPDEPMTLDGGAALGRDRDTIDRFLQVGALTHRHNGLPGLADPTQAMPSAMVVASGGSIDAGISYTFGYTARDDTLGETILSPTVTVTTPAPIQAPSQAPMGVADYSAGALLVDTYYYAKSWSDGSGGETPIGPAVTVQRAPGYANGRIVLSGLDDGMVAAGAAGWRLYRAVGGGDFHLLSTGTGDGYTDNGSDSVDCDLTPLPDGTNSTHGANSIIVQLPSLDGIIDDAESLLVYASRSGEFVGDVFLELFPIASAGRQIVYRSIDLFEGQPPDTNQSIGGAHKIDPDTELEDWHWKRPVATVGALPATGNSVSDVRIVSATQRAYTWDGDSWELWTGGGLIVSDSDESYSGIDHIHVIGGEIANLGSGQVQITVGSGGGGGSLTLSDGVADITAVQKITLGSPFGIDVAVTEVAPGEALVELSKLATFVDYEVAETANFDFDPASHATGFVIVSMDNAGALAATILDQATKLWSSGQRMFLYQKGAGTTTITPGAGVTLESIGGADNLVQFGRAELWMRDTDVWVLSGDIV